MGPTRIRRRARKNNCSIIVRLRASPDSLTFLPLCTICLALCQGLSANLRFLFVMYIFFFSSDCSWGTSATCVFRDACVIVEWFLFIDGFAARLRRCWLRVALDRCDGF